MTTVALESQKHKLFWPSLVRGCCLAGVLVDLPPNVCYLASKLPGPFRGRARLSAEVFGTIDFMQKIPMNKVVEGMVLAKPITREDGVVLMGEDTVLSGVLIEKLKALEIKRIIVKGRPLDLGAEEKTVEQFTAELDKRLRSVAADKLGGQIRNMIIRDYIQRREQGTP